MTMRILVVAPAWVGDMVMTQSLVAALAEEYPDAEVDLVAPSATRAVAERLSGVGRAWELGSGHGRVDLGARRTLGRRLRQERYTLSIVLPRSWKSALVPWFAGIPRRRGYRGEMRYGLLNEIHPDIRHRDARTVDRFVALAKRKPEPVEALTKPGMVCDPEAGRRLLNDAGIGATDRVIALCPGAEFGPSKQWPIASFSGLARDLTARGYRIAVLGGPNDAQAGAEIAGLADIANLIGKTSLADAIDVLGAVDGVVSNDSGLMHVACAVDRPVVALFGSTSPDITPPLGNQVSILQRELPCRPCFKRVCPLEHHNCMNEITPEMVCDAVMEMLARSGDARGAPSNPHAEKGA